MNISPQRYQDLVRRVEQLADQVTALFQLVANAKPRDPSIKGFCARKGISKATYERMRRKGLGPRETAAGLHRIIITAEDEAAWDQARQAAVAAEAGERGIHRIRSRDVPAMNPAE